MLTQLINKNLFFTIYVAVFLSANISSYRIIKTFNLVWDGGLFIFPISFILRDYIHHYFGKGVAKELIVNSFFSVFLFYCLITLTSFLPPMEPDNFKEVLLPGFRIFIASLISLIINESLNLIIYEKFKSNRVKAMNMSNAFSIPVDTILFMHLAFLYVWDYLNIWIAILVNLIVKFLVTWMVSLFHFLKEKK